MGITGLLPFLEKKTAKKVTLQDLSGSTAAVDTYCWLHKGVFTCADKLAMGIATDGYVTYCMNHVNLLLKFKIKPILVFDGRHLPAKAETEAKRREQREANRRKASELMKMGQIEQGKNLLKRAVDVSHEMALNVMRKCQELNVDCIVAPYEADAQLAYLNTSGIADFVITEDSDLTLFGCTKILFKMDKFGSGTLVEQDRIYLSMSLRQDDFDIEKFRHMCILSGCDYLPSLPGVGLNKALKFVQRNTEEDIHKALGRLNSYLNMKTLVVTKEYRDAFVIALITFKHQLVYCPLRRKQVRLNSPPPEVSPEQLRFAGEPVDDDLAYQLALGNCHPFSFKKLNHFDPDSRPAPKVRTNGWNEKPSASYPSIWSKNFKPKVQSIKPLPSETTKWPNTAGKEVVMNTEAINKKLTPLKRKRQVNPEKSSPLKRSSEYLDNELSKEDLMRLYGNPKVLKGDEKSKKEIQNDDQKEIEEDKTVSTPTTSPRKFNPFLKKATVSETSPSLVPRGRRRPRFTSIAVQRTVVDETAITESKFFSPAGVSDDKKTVIIPETQDEDLGSTAINLKGKVIEQNVIIPETQDDLPPKGFINNPEVGKYVIIPETLYDEVQNDEVPDLKIERIEKNVIIPETLDEQEMPGDQTPRNSTNVNTMDAIIPESPDQDELPLSQGSCKENDDSTNIPAKTPEKDPQIITRSDSGVDMKEDTMGKTSPNNSLCEIEENFLKADTRTSGLNITVKKYGLKSPEASISRIISADDLDEFAVSAEPINSVQSSFFKWPQSKATNGASNYPSISTKRSLASQNKVKNAKRPGASKKLPPVDSQQSLLNMYGFRRKTNLKQ